MKKVTTVEGRPLKCHVGKSFAGLGLFATELIPKNETIIEYQGDILNAKEAEGKAGSMYLFEVSKNKTIDGTPRWNTARYANHSCDGNAESELRKGRVFFVATRDIQPGEEITFDYGSQFFDEYIKGKGCLCGTEKCVSKKANL